MIINDIELNDIYYNSHIDNNTPIIIAKLTNRYFNNIYNNIFEIDIDRLHDKNIGEMSFIDLFYPVGQIELTDNAYHEVLLLNKNIFQMKNTYKNIENNVWYAYSSNGKSLGTILSKNEPKTYIPIIPNKLLVKSEKKIFNTFTIPSYGIYNINTNLLGVKKNNVRIISINGDIESYNIPVKPNDLIDNTLKSDDNYDKKIFFSTQGDIKLNSNCINPFDNILKHDLNVCNATTTYNIKPINISSFDENESVSNLDITYSKKSKMKNNKRVILKESDNPWFKDEEYIGKHYNNTLSHKITNNNINNNMNNDNITHKIENFTYDKENFDDDDELWFDKNSIIISIIIIIILILILCKY